jgi:eukaryotic-like serine/threonine-protein kinase
VLATPSGLCRECASTSETADPTPRDLPSRPEPPTASFLPGAAPDLDPTATAAPAPSTTATDGPRPLPHAPPGYELLERLGGGGMGEVYLARESASERLVAMKFVRHPGNPNAFERFLVELRVLARLEHPHIVRVLSSDFLRADPFFTMEYLPGGTLARTASGSMPVGEAVRLVRAVADAVAVAHAEQVIHRDLKPSNILLTADGTPKVADFGLAKRLDEADPLTVASGALGTPGYMPPEQISRKNGEIGPWSDVYGLGATLYHLLTGRAPFVGETPTEVVSRVLADFPDRPRVLRPEVPAALEGIVSKCLEKDPKDRYQSAAELVADLDRFRTGQKPEAPVLTPWRRAKRWGRRNRWRLAGLGVAVLLAVSLVWIGMAAAPVPKLPPAEPTVEPIQAIRNELAADRRSVLLGASGRPRHARWLIGTATVIEPTEATPAFAFEAPQVTQLELLADPGVPRYRVTAEFQLRYHKAIVVKGERREEVGFEGAALLGLYVGDVALATADGHPVHLSTIATYIDYYPKEFRAALPQLRGTAALQTAAVVARAEGPPQSTTASGTKPLRFPLADDLPAPWRRVRLDVGPEGVAMFWAASPAAEWQPVTERTAAEITADLVRKAGGLGVALAAHAPPAWKPASCGVWCRGAAVAVRNVTVEVP